MSGPGDPARAVPGAAGPSLLAWAAGAGLLAGCVDILAGVLLGLHEGPADPSRTGARDLAAFAALAGFLSLGASAAAWSRRPRGLALAAAFHLLAAAAAWFGPPRMVGGIPRPLVAAAAVHLLASVAAVAGLSAGGAGAGDGARDRLASAARAGAENLESVLVAIVFALVIRHFAVEAYKIPTESMAPTLLGDNPARGPGDRVLVAKWTAALGVPDRWEVWVFRPPLDRTINYVKRVVGLGGETVEVRDGDLFVNGTVARKPPRTREDMWFPVWPRTDGQAETASPWAGEGFRREGEDGFAISGAKERRLLRYGPPVRDAVFGRSGSNTVGDVRLRFGVSGAEPGTVLVTRIVGKAGPVEVRLAADGSAGSVSLNGVEGGLAALPGRPVEEVEVSFADLLFRVTAGGRTIAETAMDALPAETRPAYGVALGVDRGGAVFRDVRLDRDVFYTGSHRFQVPEGHYLFLGDNSAHSQDSRMWRGWEVREKGPGGRVFVADSRPSALSRAGRVEFRDRNGVFRSFAPGEVEVSASSVPIPFVPAADLHGRAFAIFWPPRFFTKVAGGRVRPLP